MTCNCCKQKGGDTASLILLINSLKLQLTSIQIQIKDIDVECDLSKLEECCENLTALLVKCCKDLNDRLDGIDGKLDILIGCACDGDEVQRITANKPREVDDKVIYLSNKAIVSDKLEIIFSQNYNGVEPLPVCIKDKDSDRVITLINFDGTPFMTDQINAGTKYLTTLDGNVGTIQITEKAK